MSAFAALTSRSVVLRQSNIDTDQIIPARFLSTTERAGLGKHAFNDWRWQADGSPNPEFAFNQSHNAGRRILLAGANFGCGSSREHAPWALLDFGIRCVISTSFADIFYNNCFKNGILPIVVSPENLDKLMDDASRGSNAILTVDLEAQEITGPDGGKVAFEIDAFKRHCLLNGLDDIGLTLEKAKSIDTFEAKYNQSHSWI